MAAKCLAGNLISNNFDFPHNRTYNLSQ